MAQHDQIVDNGPGRAVRLDINAALAALFSNNSGVVEPATLVPGQSWYDVSDPEEPRFLIRNPSNDGWLNIATDLSPSSYVERSANFTVAPTDLAQFMQTTSPLTAILPPITELDDRWFIWFQSYSGTLTLQPQGVDRIDDGISLAVPQGYSVMVRCTGQGFRTTQIPLTTPKLETIVNSLPVMTEALVATDRVLILRSNGTLALGNQNQFGSPPGTILMFGGPTTPAGHIACQGAAVSRTTYAALFAAIGTWYGSGDGSTTFNLPDFRGIFPRGWDNGRGVDPSRSFGSLQGSMFASHAHSISDPGHAHNYNYSYWDNTKNGSLDGYPGYAKTVGAGTSASGTGIGIYAAGGNETRPINLAVLFVIKY